MEHLDGMVAPEENLSDDEVQFRFFKVHDYNNDNQLDGIELIAALTDYHGKGWNQLPITIKSSKAHDPCMTSQMILFVAPLSFNFLRIYALYTFYSYCTTANAVRSCHRSGSIPVVLCFMQIYDLVNRNLKV